MKISVKECIWRDIYLKPNVNVEEVIRFIEEEPFEDIYDNDDLYDDENELALDTAHIIQPSYKQNGYSTIEIRSNSGEILWNNSELNENSK